MCDPHRWLTAKKVEDAKAVMVAAKWAVEALVAREQTKEEKRAKTSTINDASKKHANDGGDKKQE